MEDDQQFCLRWNNHQSTLIAVFDTLLENGTLVDCTLAAEGKYLNAHKVVLSACSPYFESLLSQNYDKHPIFILKDVKFQELKAMMDYMYRGEVNISQDQLSALLRAAESLQIKGLSDNRAGGSSKSAGSDGDHGTPAKKQALSSGKQQLPNKGQGLTITEPSRRMGGSNVKTAAPEQPSQDDRDGSMSPGPSRRRKRARRKSTDTDDHLNHHDGASNSSESHQSGSMMTTAATTTASNKINVAQDTVPAPIDTKADILAQAAAQASTNRTNEQLPSSSSSSTSVPNLLNQKQEPSTSANTSSQSNIISHAEVMLEPKSEYIDDMNEDSIEDLTLDDDDLSNMEGQMGEDGAGPSGGHGGESSQDPIYGLLQPTRTSAPSLAATSRHSAPKQRLPRLIRANTVEEHVKTSSRIIRKPKRYITEIDENSDDSDVKEDFTDPLAYEQQSPPAQQNQNLIPILNTFAVDSSTIQGAQYDVDMLMYGLGGNMRKYAPETVRWALDAILNRGASVTAASQASGIKRTSLHLYLKKLNIRKVRYEGGEVGLLSSLVGLNSDGFGETSGGLIIEEVKSEEKLQ